MTGRSIPVGRINADVFTSPHAAADMDPAPELIAAIGQATTSIHFAIYSLTHQGIADALAGALIRGVPIIGVCDATEAKAATSKIRSLVALGMDIREWGGNYRLMHEKLLVVDGATPNAVVALGSYNWTTQAEKSNVEVLMVAHGIQVSRALATTLIAQIIATHEKATPLTLEALAEGEGALHEQDEAAGSDADEELESEHQEPALSSVE